MSERAFSFSSNNPGVQVTSSNWGAIWAGTFAFVAIWSIFGLLGEAIFASIENPNVANPISRMNVGIGVWTVILTIIAMFVGGLTTGRLAGVLRRGEAIMLGTTMFGLSIVAALVISVLGELGFGNSMAAAGTAHVATASGVFVALGWIGFVALFLGWLAAIAGASSTVQRSAVMPPAEQVRRAAA